MHSCECWGLALTIMNRVNRPYPLRDCGLGEKTDKFGRELQSSTKCLDRGRNRVRWNTGGGFREQSQRKGL